MPNVTGSGLSAMGCDCCMLRVPKSFQITSASGPKAATHLFALHGEATDYRYVDLDYEFDDDDSGVRTSTNFELTGPYVGLKVGW